MIRICKNLSLGQFQKLAQTIAREFAQGGIIGLNGPLGSGKTEFAKSVGKVLKIKGIKSPSFTVINAYPKQRFYHIDLYRLKRLKELSPIGIIELLHSSGNLVLIEWINRFPKLLKSTDIVVNIKVSGPNHRHVKLISQKKLPVRLY